jgi:hAT family C-terminal dimerisation region
MKDNDIYYIASVLDPRVKTRVIQKYVPNPDEVIERIQKFLKATYRVEPELPPQRNEASTHKSLEYEFLEEYESTWDDSTENDIDRYFNTPPVKFVLDKKEDQTIWALNYWLGNKWDFPLMFEVARDYMAVAASEVDIERLFSGGRDMLGVRRWSLQAKTMRSLTLLKDDLKRRAEEKSTGKATENTMTA